MAGPARDRWAEWVLRRQHGGKVGMEHTSDSAFLRSLRDRVLGNAGLVGGETVLDVGAGDGLISFGALDLVGEGGRVVFSDVSEDLLDHSRSLAKEMGVLDRCTFLLAPATDLSVLGDGFVDVVTTRSVLIYVDDKRGAFEEFHRVLAPGGRLSIFEPINSFGYPPPPDRFVGYGVAPVQDLARKVSSVYERAQPPRIDPMLNFDERDLFRLAAEAGFDEIHLDYEAGIRTGYAHGEEPPRWEDFLNSSGNPRIPTLREAMQEVLTPREAERFSAHLRPLVEAGEQRLPVAVAYLRAVK